MSLAAFLQMMAVQRGAAPSTVEGYRRSLADYQDCLAGEGEEEGDGIEPERADADATRRYLMRLARSSTTSASASLSRVRAMGFEGIGRCLTSFLELRDPGAVLRA